jgi:lipopolysaccharide/colanic/teichoic acid biosynthesis glycosyltransferase
LPPIRRAAVGGWSAPAWLSVGRDGGLRAKRFLDLVLASVLVVASLPVLALAMLAVRVSSPGPVIFRQLRVGYRREHFVVFKLRTMRCQAPGGRARPGVPGGRTATGAPAEGRIFEKVGNGDARVTAVGKVLRKLSLDELPQLFNVLRGEMSLVGPRPLLLADMRAFPAGRPMRRFNMKPGLTGLWQVSGRSLLSDEERIRLDLAYVERWSLWLDLGILLRTPLAVILGRGAI